MKAKSILAFDQNWMCKSISVQVRQSQLLASQSYYYFFTTNNGNNYLENNEDRMLAYLRNCLFLSWSMKAGVPAWTGLPSAFGSLRSWRCQLVLVLSKKKKKKFLASQIWRLRRLHSLKQNSHIVGPASGSHRLQKNLSMSIDWYSLTLTQLWKDIKRDEKRYLKQTGISMRRLLTQ